MDITWTYKQSLPSAVERLHPLATARHTAGFFAYPPSSRLDTKLQLVMDGSTTIHFGPRAPDGHETKLDPDRGRQRLVHDLEAVRPLANLVRENLETGQDRRRAHRLPAQRLVQEGSSGR